MAKLSPSFSRTSVSALRWESAGIRKPCSVTELAKSSELTSGATFKLMAPAAVTVGVKLSCNHRRGRAARGRGRQHGKGERSAGQEAGFLALQRDQVRLGQDLQQVP